MTALVPWEVVLLLIFAPLFVASSIWFAASIARSPVPRRADRLLEDATGFFVGIAFILTLLNIAVWAAEGLLG